MRTYSRISPIRFVLFVFVFFLALSTSSSAQNNPDSNPPAAPGPKIGWQQGPFTAKLGSIAQIKVPEGYMFADGDGARRYLELTHNPAEGTEIGILTPISDAKEDQWVIFFDFDESGYVKDDDKSSIDAAKILDSIKRGTEEENVERKKRGWTAFHITSWQTQPFYDTATHNLTWGTFGNTDDPKEGVTINYATRILGRRGVVRVDLITDPVQVDATLPKFKEVMTGFSFVQGSRYADFVKGDKVAAFGLTALIAGGATAVALKTGLFAKLLALLAGLWKLIAVAFAALLTRIKNIIAAIKSKFERKTGYKSDE
jgi:uncharacterized membrane-anchored protein